MTYICSDCITESDLADRINTDGTRQVCDECHTRKRRTYSLKRLAAIIDEVFQYHYRPGEEVPYFANPEDDRPGVRQKGEDFSSVIQDLLGTYLNCHEELLAEIAELDDSDPYSGEPPIYDDFTNYERVKYWAMDGDPEWDDVLNDIKYSSRFFSQKAKDFFSFVFEDYERLSARVGPATKPVVARKKKGLRLYRARVAKDNAELNEFAKNPFSTIGPPPQRFEGRGGRMNASGITVLYCAMDVQTCLAEMRPAIGSNMAVIEMGTTRTLRLLDFERLEYAINSQILGEFHPEYFRARRRLAIQQRLHHLVSRPVTPDKESDYLITQTMSEYLYRVHPRPFDGIIFRSAQRKSGKNVVLFPERTQKYGAADKRFAVEYIENSAQVYSTEAVRYTHSQPFRLHEHISFDFLIPPIGIPDVGDPF